MPDKVGLKFLFVINPIAGGKQKGEWEQAIRDYFEALPHTVEIYLLGNDDDQNAIKRLLTDYQPDRVGAVGGDGTVTMLAKQLRDSEMALGIIPAGSANGMAKDLGIPGVLNEALAVMVGGEVQKIDLIQINDEICLHLSDIGLNAQLIKYFEEGKLRGKLGYAKVLLKVLWKKEKMQVIVGTKDQQVRRNAFMVVIANASKYGFGTVINPVGNIDDGTFEVVIVRRLALSELLKMIFRPQPFNPKKIETFHARSVSIETMKHAHFQVDGEYLGKVKKINGKILPSALTMILPKETKNNN